MWGRSAVVLGALLMIAAGVAFGAQRKLSHDLQGLKPSDQVNVIVQFNHVPTAKDHKSVLRLGGQMRRELRHIRSGAYSIPAAVLASLEGNPNVAYISPDRRLYTLGSTVVPVTGPEVDYHTDTIQAPAAWAQGLDGSGIGVAVIDSGIAPVGDLNGSALVYSQDFAGDNAQGNDLYGHGTHVAGIIAGNGSGSTGAGVLLHVQRHCAGGEPDQSARARSDWRGK